MKVVRNIVMIILIIGVISVGYIGIQGYQLYQEAVTKVSLEDKVNQMRNKKGYVAIANIPKEFKNAVISIEDHRFQSHFGIDFIATGRAVVENIKAFSLVEGGSTITQQLAKNMYFTQEKKFTRKIAELFVAFQLEKEYSKEDIIEMYMNVIYFGNGYYGVGTASRGYFNKEPNQLDLYECTLLAGIPNAPSVYALNSNPKLAKERQELVINCMVKYQYLSSSEAQTVLNKVD